MPGPTAVFIYTKQVTAIREQKSSHSPKMPFGRVRPMLFCVCRSIVLEPSSIDAFKSSPTTYLFNMPYPSIYWLSFCTSIFLWLSSAFENGDFSPFSNQHYISTTLLSLLLVKGAPGLQDFCYIITRLMNAFIFNKTRMYITRLKT